jgi:hypothetical protein
MLLFSIQLCELLPTIAPLTFSLVHFPNPDLYRGHAKAVKSPSVLQAKCPNFAMNSHKNLII